MAGNHALNHDATANMPQLVFQRSVLHESSTVEKPEDYGRSLLSAIQLSQQQVSPYLPTNAPRMAPFGIASNDEISRRVNPFPVELTWNDQADSTARQSLGDGSCISSLSAQQVGSSAAVSSSFSDANLDALSRQIMLAGMAALGMNTPSLPKQAVPADSNASLSMPALVNPNFNFALPSMEEYSVKSSVPDGSGLLKYRAPEIESFVFDRNTGYRFDPTTGLHYDANTGFYINVALKIFMRWDPLSNTYLRESKRTGPSQNVDALLNSPSNVSNIQSTLSSGPIQNVDALLKSLLNVPEIQSTMSSTSSDDATQRLTADSVNALLGNSAQHGYTGMKIPADVASKLAGLQGGYYMRELQQLIRSFDCQGESFKINQVPESTCGISYPKNEYKGESDHDTPKGNNREQSSSKSLTDARVLHRARKVPGKRRARKSRSSSNSSSSGRRSRSSSHSSSSGQRSRSRSNSRRKRPRVAAPRRRSSSRGRRRSRSHSREARKRRRSRSKQRRRSRSRETRRSWSRGQRRRRSESPRHDMRGYQRRTGGYIKNNMRQRSLNKDGDPHLPNHELEMSPPPEQNTDTSLKCFKCNQYGHSSSDCKEKGIYCYGCLQMCDHIAANCPIRPTVKKQNAKFGQKNPKDGQKKKAGVWSRLSPRASDQSGKESSNTAQASTSFRLITCYKCGLNGHNSKECRSGGIYCYSCHQIGDHKLINCPIRLARRKKKAFNQKLKGFKGRPGNMKGQNAASIETVTNPNEEDVQPESAKTALVSYSSDSGESNCGSEPNELSSPKVFKRKVNGVRSTPETMK